MAIASVNRGPFRQRYLIVRLGDMYETENVDNLFALSVHTCNDDFKLFLVKGSDPRKLPEEIAWQVCGSCVADSDSIAAHLRRRPRTPRRGLPLARRVSQSPGQSSPTQQ